jgi:hypothetical protein
MLMKDSGRSVPIFILATVIGPANTAHATLSPLYVPNNLSLFRAFSNIRTSVGEEGSSGVAGERASPMSSALTACFSIDSTQCSYSFRSVLSDGPEESDFERGEGVVDDFLSRFRTGLDPFDGGESLLQSKAPFRPHVHLRGKTNLRHTTIIGASS